MYSALMFSNFLDFLLHYSNNIDVQCNADSNYFENSVEQMKRTSCYSQGESFVVFWRPVCGFRFCDQPPLLVREVRSNQVDFNEWLERLGLGPLQIIGSHN